jgi:hypothetical protein
MGASPTTDDRTLAATLSPVLKEACEGRLGEIAWFRADWQRSGAATATSTYDTGNGPPTRVVLKLPVNRRELTWLRRLQDPDDPDPVVPRVYAADDTLGGYDLAWVVMERFDYGPLGSRWHDDHIPRVAEAAARFHARTDRFDVSEGPRAEPWDAMLGEALESVRVNELPDGRRWRDGIKAVRDRLGALLAEWDARDAGHWLHGDLHLANAMSRHALDHGTVSLIDFAEIHAGHWIEDAVYLERQLWARPERMAEHRPAKEVAAARRRLGLSVEPDYSRLAMVRRLLLAASAPKFIRSEGHPRHLAACLDWVDAALAELR